MTMTGWVPCSSTRRRTTHDQFLQRRGRAGRDPAMRPWTAVVLSGWGRDRRAWQLYEDLFDPGLTGPGPCRWETAMSFACRPSTR